MIYSFQNTASQIDQAIQSAYTGLVLAGTGLVRLTGNQSITGVKTFNANTVFSGDIEATGNSSFDKVNLLKPVSNNTVDIGTSSLRFGNGYFNNVDSNSGSFTNLTVTNLTASVNVNLVDKTGENFTVSGTSRFNNLTVSGNTSITGNLNVTGSTTLNNTVISGTVYSTGNKTFSGSLFQTGNVNISGDLILRGNSRITGSSYVSGNSTTIGNIFTTGNINHSGGLSIKSYTENFNFQADNTATFNITAPVNITGPINLDGNLNIAADPTKALNLGIGVSLSMSGSFNNGGSLTNSGNISGLNILSTGFISGKLIASGTSANAGLKLYDNASISPEVGAIEFSRNSLLFSKNNSLSSYRYSIPSIYHYFTNNEIVFDFMTGGPNRIPCRFLGSTGILLDTGAYKIESFLSFRKGATLPTGVHFGFSGDDCLFTYRNGSINETILITGNNAVAAFSGNLGNLTASVNKSGIFVGTIVVTGFNHKIYPFLYSFGPAGATGKTTGSFNMTVTQLQTGTGNISFNGPWIA